MVHTSCSSLNYYMCEDNIAHLMHTTLRLFVAQQVEEKMIALERREPYVYQYQGPTIKMQ